jgi:serine phosphatase RsbU (regulator of sigma subunit)
MSDAAPERSARRGVSISLKLIGTTALLLLFTVGLYGAMNLQDLAKVFDTARDDQQDVVLEAVASTARNVTETLGTAATVVLAGAQYAELEALLGRTRKNDPRLLYIEVFEEAGGKPDAASGEAAQTRAGLTAAATPPQLSARLGEDAVAGLKFFERAGVLDLLEITVPLGGGAAGGSGGRVIAGWSVAELTARQARIETQAAERERRAMIDGVLVGGLIVLLGVLLTVLQSLAISRPLRALSRVVDKLARGELGQRAVVQSGDEIGELARNFNTMAERIGVLIKDTKAKATYEKELEVARVIQEALLPPSHVIRAGGMQFIGHFKSASICGGDWWSYAELPGGRLLMLIGDVTGHGVSSAMITAAAKSCCDTLRHVTEGDLTVSFLLEELNQTIYEAAHRKFVMTFFATIIDPATKTITFSNAGHNFPLLFRRSAGPDEPAIVPLVTRGNRLGDEVSSRFVERTVPYTSGDVLVWYTDGITEGLDAHGEEYGEKRFRRSIRAALDAPVDAILERVLSDAERWFADFSHPEDDITLVVGRFL